MPLAYTTSDCPGTGGVIRQRPEDFLVEEQPLYEPSGQGEHIYLLIEKTNLTTPDAVRQIARAMDVPLREVSYAGLKDKRAVTRQLISVRAPGSADRDAERVAPLAGIEGLTVHWHDRHGNKLRRGHLAGNRFVVYIREVAATSVVRAKPILDRLIRDGMANYVGEQRFGARGQGHLVGMHMLRRAWDEAVAALLAHESADDSPGLVKGREAFAAGDLDAAAAAWPRALRPELHVLEALRRGRSPEKALRAMPRNQAELYFNAFQSHLFNLVLKRRVIEGTWRRLVAGDLAWKHENGALFAVDEATAAVENEAAGRAAVGTVSPSGPIWGRSMARAAGAVDGMETGVLAEGGFAPEALATWPPFVPGSRRPLRVMLTDAELSGGVDEHGPYVRVAFTLPPGAYATVLLREIMKHDQPDRASRASARDADDAMDEASDEPAE